MSYERKEGTGTIFENDSEHPQSPVYSGKIKIGGKEYELALWWAEDLSGNARLDNKGKNYFSAKIKEPWKKQEPTGSQSTTGYDDVPY